MPRLILSVGAMVMILGALAISACDLADKDGSSDEVRPDSESSSAAVVEVKVSGQEGAYQFTVTLESPDLGCNQYADWWEVITPEGRLLYRRILAHSHVEEQPFARSGGPVPIMAMDSIIVRGHMNVLGYGVQAAVGSVNSGLHIGEIDPKLAKDLDKMEPLPTSCQF